MQFGLFGSAAARRGGPDFDSSEGYRDFIEYNIEAEALGFHSTFVVEHHFTGYGQVSATLNLLTWLGARTRWLRLGTAVIVLPWHNPVLLAEQVATMDDAAIDFVSAEALPPARIRSPTWRSCSRIGVAFLNVFSPGAMRMMRVASCTVTVTSVPESSAMMTVLPLIVLIAPICRVTEVWPVDSEACGFC